MNTQRLSLRPPTLGDLDAVLSIHGDPATNRFNPAGPMRDLGAARSMLAEWQAAWQRDGIGYWIAHRLSTGQLIGFGGVMRRAWHGREIANLYYRLTPSAWGNGYALELARAAMAQAQLALPGLPVVVRTRPGNAGAIRVAERAGLSRRPDLDDDDLVFALGWNSGYAEPPSSRT